MIVEIPVKAIEKGDEIILKFDLKEITIYFEDEKKKRK